MSLETQRFSWQKLLINQVPRIRGETDAEFWQRFNVQLVDKAQQTINSVKPLVDEVLSMQEQIKTGGSESFHLVQNNNNKIRSKLSEVDNTISNISSIPDNNPIFNRSFTKGALVNNLNQARQSLAGVTGIVADLNAYKDYYRSAVLDFIKTGKPLPWTEQPTSKTTDQSAIDAAKSDALSAQLGYDTTQYRSAGLQPANPASVCTLPVPSVPPPPQTIPAALGCIPAPSYEIYPSNPSVLSGKGTWVCDGPVLGTGSYAGADKNKLKISVDQVWAEDGIQYLSPKLVPNGLRYSYTRWRFIPNFVPPPPPPPTFVPRPILIQQTEIEFYKQQLANQTRQLQSINRILNKPVEPGKSEDIWPVTSWQYEFWNKGYTVSEISFAEDTAVKLRLLDSTKGDFELFKVKVEDLLQDSILSNQIESRITQEITPSYPRCGLDENGRPVIPDELKWWTSVQPYQPIDPGLDQPTICPPPPPVCQLPTPYIDPRTGKPADPKKVPPALRRDRNFISRRSNRPIDLEDMPQVATCTPNIVPTKGRWEDCLVGNGATVAELDTVRRTMAQIKLAPNADICAVAQNVLTQTRGYTEQAKAQTGVVAPGKNGTGINQDLYRQNTMNSINGVQRCNIAPIRVVRQNAMAQQRASQSIRPSAVRAQTRRPATPFLNEGGNGGGNN